MILKASISFLVITLTANHLTFACNGYKAKFKKIENCAGPDSIISMDSDFSIKLNKKCELIPSGCVTNKAFSIANAKYAMKKNGIVMKDGTVDICAAVTSIPNEAKEFMHVFGIPESCPVQEDKICPDGQKVDLSKYKNLLSMVRGDILVDFEIDHDTGKSCFHIELEITK